MSVSAPAPARRESLLGRAALVLVLVFLGLFALRRVGSPDAGWHLRTGRDVLAQRGWPELDAYTYTVAERANLATSWAYDVALALVDAALGVAGLTLVHAGLVVLAFALVTRTAGLAQRGAGTLALLLLVGGVACEERFEVRPELVSYACLAAALLLLQRHALQEPARLWLLVPLFWAWSNSHSLHVVGWGVLACFVLGTWIARRRLDRRLALWSAAAVASALLNPYGWRGVAQNLSLATRLSSRQVFGQTIAEYASPFATLTDVDQLHLHVVPILCLFVYAGAVLLSLPALVRARRFSCVLLAALGLGLAFAMERNAPLLVVMTLPGAAWGLPPAGLLRRLPAGEAARRRLALGVQASALLLAVVGALRVTSDAYYAGRGRLERFGLGWNRWLLPVDAVEWMRAAGLEGRMLNHLNLGGHLIGALQRPVFADGRLEVMGEQHYRATLAAFATLEGLEDAARRHGCDWVVFPYRVVPHLVQPLVESPRWRLVYFDPLVALFVRAGTNEAVTVHERVHALAGPAPALDLASVPGLGAVPRRDPLLRWLAGLVERQRYPVEDYCLGVFHYLRGDLERLAWHSAQALRATGGARPELWANLGSALYALGRLEPARASFLLALEELPPWSARRRGVYIGLAGDLERALQGRGR